MLALRTQDLEIAQTRIKLMSEEEEFYKEVEKFKKAGSIANLYSTLLISDYKDLPVYKQQEEDDVKSFMLRFFTDYFTEEEILIQILHKFYKNPSENKELCPDIILNKEFLILAEQLDDKGIGILEHKYKCDKLEPIDYKVIQIEQLLIQNPNAKKSDIANKLNVAWNTANKYLGLAEERIRIQNLLVEALVMNNSDFIVFCLYYSFFPKIIEKIQAFSLIH